MSQGLRNRESVDDWRKMSGRKHHAHIDSQQADVRDGVTRGWQAHKQRKVAASSEFYHPSKISCRFGLNTAHTLSFLCSGRLNNYLLTYLQICRTLKVKSSFLLVFLFSLLSFSRMQGLVRVIFFSKLACIARKDMHNP